MPRISLVLVTLLFATAYLPAPDASPAPAAVELGIPGALAFRTDGEGRVEALAATPTRALIDALAAAYADPADFDSVRGLLRALDSAPALGGDVRAPAADSWPGFAMPFPQGDADGDGFGDAFLIFRPEERGGTTYTFRMVSQGAVLWTDTVDAAFAEAAPAVDLDGDGLTDVVILDVRYDPVVRERYEWRVRAVRGADGAVMWERVERGAFLAPTAPAPFQGRAFASTAYAFAPLIGGDADGDGGADVWLNVISVARPDAAGVDPEVRTDRFELLSGATGDLVSATALAAGPAGFCVVLPAGDFTGDGLADSLATAFVGKRFGEPRATVVSALDGRTSLPVWVARYDVLALGLPVTDLTGDGAADALAFVERGWGVREGLDGVDGRTMWTADDRLLYEVVPGNVDGVGGDDILLVDATWDTERRATAVHMRALRGDDGGLVYDVKPAWIGFPFGGGYSIVGVNPLAGDFDGDGVQDALTHVENGQDGRRLESGASLVDGATGRVEWALAELDHVALPAGDLTGDGLADAAYLHLPTDGSPKSLSGLAGADAARLWTRAVEADEVAVLVAGDLGGGAEEDVLLALVSGDPRGGGATTRLAAWGGADGIDLWGS